MRAILIATCLVLAASAAQAQVGGITVKVTDESGAPLPGATVTIRHETSYVKTTSELTDAHGIVRFPVLRPGDGYTIEVSFPGLTPLRFGDLRVRLNEDQQLDVRLTAGLVEEVHVTAEGQVVQLDQNEVSTKFSDDFIHDLPVLDRFYQNVLTLAPGVQDANGDGNPNVHGSRNRDFQALVGGVSNVDPLTGQWLSRVNPKSIEEIEIIGAGAGVEFGRAQGGFARIIQKQGSNQHEGVLDFYYQTSDLDGDGARNESAVDAPEFETIQPGFQFTGPVVRDRLWYRVSYDRRKREEPTNVLSGIELFKQDAVNADAQLTWQASPSNKLALQYRTDPVDEENFGISNRTPVESSIDRERDVDTWTLTWTAQHRARVLVETIAAWQDVALSEEPAVLGALNDCVPNSSVPVLGRALCLNLQTDRYSGSFNESDSDERQRFTFKSQATVYAGRLWGADHQAKLGLSVENERYFRDLRRLPTMDYHVEFPFGGVPFGVVLAEVDVPYADHVRATGVNWALYAEDQLKLGSNLTLTLGTRIDREEIDSEGRAPLDLQGELAAYDATLTLKDVGAFDIYDVGEWDKYFTGYEQFFTFREQLSTVLCQGQPPEVFPNCQLTVSSGTLSQLQEELDHKRQSEGIHLRNTNLSPFLAVAWDPWANGKTALKAAAGRHYNNIPLVVPLQELEPVRSTVEYRSDLETSQTNLYGGISPNLTVRTVDHDLRTPYQDELSLSFERELWPETSLRFSWVNRSFEDQLQDRNLNIGTADYGVCASAFVQIFQQTNVLPSPGQGKQVTNPWTGEKYQDTDPGNGDGRTDDCGGNSFFQGGSDPFGSDSIFFQSPDGFDDLYVLNPFWGGVFEIGNINTIDYDAYVLEFVRRLYHGWEFNGSYTWSETKGDGEDLVQELANDPSLRDSVFGFQSYDQRHVVKLTGTTITPIGVRLGSSVTWQSGLPYSILLEDTAEDLLPPTTSRLVVPGTRLRQTYPTGVRNDQRNDSWWNVDLKATKELRFGRRYDLQLSAEVFNVLNDDTYQIYNPFLEQGQRINGVNEAARRFGRRFQVGAQLAF